VKNEGQSVDASPAPHRLMTAIEHGPRNCSEVERSGGALGGLARQHGVLPLRHSRTTALLSATWRDCVEPSSRRFCVFCSRRSSSAIHRSRSCERRFARVYAPEASDRRGPDSPALERRRAHRHVRTRIPLADLLSRTSPTRPPVRGRRVDLLLSKRFEALARRTCPRASRTPAACAIGRTACYKAAPSPPPHLTPRSSSSQDHGGARHRRAAAGAGRAFVCGPRPRHVDVRVSTVPPLRGESVVARLLDKERGRSRSRTGDGTDTSSGSRSCVSSGRHRARHRPLAREKRRRLYPRSR